MSRTTINKHSKNDWSVYYFCAVLIDLGLLTILLLQRTDVALQTPWVELPFGFFLLFGLSSALLLSGARHARPRVFWIAALLHSFLFYGVALLVFRHGYGYDPIIHQAAEEYIVDHRAIQPLSPLYFGQYAVVSALHFLTSIPVRLIDRALLPVLAALSVPIVSYIGLLRTSIVFRNRVTDGSNPVTEKRFASSARSLTLLVPLLAIPSLTFTTPYNLTVLLAFWWIFLLPFLGQNPLPDCHPELVEGSRIFRRFQQLRVTSYQLPVTLFLIAFAAAITHPLLGVPLVLANVFTLIIRRVPKSSSPITIYYLPFTVCLITTSLIILFGLYRFTHGASFFGTTPFVQSITELATLLFARVSWTTAPWYLVLFYAIAWAIPFGVSIVGLRQLFRSETPSWYRITVLSLAVGLLLSVPFVYSAADIPGILESDQAEFVRRLLLAIPIFFLPSFLLGFLRITCLAGRQANLYESTNSSVSTSAEESRVIHRFQQLRVTSYQLLVPILLTISWYTTYPQVNAAVQRVGWNVAAYDLAAVQAIERDAAAEPYVVLSDRLLAAVGLRELGMDQRLTAPTGESTYPYAVAPNELLFPYAQKFLHAEFTSNDLEDLKRRTGVTRVYFAIHEYSSRVQEVTNAARLLGAQSIINAPSGIRLYWR